MSGGGLACETGALPPRWDAWYSPSGPPPDRTQLESDLRGLGVRAAKGGVLAKSVAPSRHLPTRLDFSLDAVSTRGVKSFGRCVYAPDRFSTEYAPPLPTPAFVAGVFTRPRNMPDPNNPHQKAWV